MYNYILSGFSEEMEKIATLSSVGRHLYKHRGKYMAGTGLVGGLTLGAIGGKRKGLKEGVKKGRIEGIVKGMDTKQPNWKKEQLEGERQTFRAMNKYPFPKKLRFSKQIYKNPEKSDEYRQRSIETSKKEYAKKLARDMEKTSGFKKSIPWAVSRGITGAGSTVAIGLTMNKVLKDLKKRQRAAEEGKLEVSKIWDKKYMKKHPKLKRNIAKAEAVAPLAAVGGGIGLAKGFTEKNIEQFMKKIMKVK